ncbi:hypothetical protein J3B02_001288 [Coemansia erecta]|nr:hypothetical protein J3B02_001288 [Coemansia erecta]
MSDNSLGSRSKQGHQTNAGSPLRIYTRPVASDRTQDDMLAKHGEATNELVGSAFSRPFDAESAAATSNSDVQTAGKMSRVAPRGGRHGVPYHPLPSHWRELESGSSSVGSPVTPDSAPGDDVSSTRGVQQPLAQTTLHKAKAKALGQSPAASPRIHVGALREAFGSSSSLEWTNDRPASTYSFQSTDANQGYVSEIQAESPLDVPAHGGRFPPSLSSMAARPSGMRGALTVHNGASRHHASASTSSSHYSFAVNSPPIRGTGSTAQFASSKDPSQPAPDEASTAQSEDIVRKYLGLQRRSPSGSNTIHVPDMSQKQRQQQTSSSKPATIKASAISPQGPSASAATEDADGAASPVEESSGSIVYRRAVSSGDLPTLEDLHEGTRGNLASNPFDNRNFLTPDLVESPLEALVRRLTIELFQLYVSEDRRKSIKGPSTDTQSQQQPQPQHQPQPHQHQLQQHQLQQPQSQRPDTSGEFEGFDDVDESTRSGYVQQFRLGPSMRSGSLTPAVTMDGYFVPQNAEPASLPSFADPTAAEGEARPRPRHRLIQRTWMEEALLKARRVSTIDENAEESILEALSDASKTPSPIGREDLAQFMASQAASAPRVAQRGQAAKLFAAGSQGGRSLMRMDASRPGEESAEATLDARPEAPFLQNAGSGGHVMSPRGYYRARDPAAPHRKLPSAERRPRDHLLASSISPARASLLRAVGRRQSVRLQPGKGQIVVAETQMGSRAPSPEQTAGIVEPDAMSRAKRANSLPGLMQVPETREVSYKEQQHRAARQVELKKSRRSRARMVHRAERMVLGGSQPTSSRGNVVRDGRKHTMHKRAASRVDMDQQLVKVELPPPVPLRVRREQVKIVPEPLIIVRQQRKTQQQQQQQQVQVQTQKPAEPASSEQRILRMHNQLLGAQAVLSRHNSIMRSATLRKQASGRSGQAGTAAAKGPTPRDAPSAIRSEALDVVMLDNALDDRIEDDEKQRFAEARERRRRVRRENAPDAAAETEDSEAAAITPWRTARRRSTLRKKGQPQPVLPLSLGVDAGSVAVMAPPSPDAHAIPSDSRFRVHIAIPLARGATALKTARDTASKRAGEDDEAEERRLVRQEERIRRACHVFEKNTSEAVVYLINRDIIDPVPDTVAGFLYRCTALSRRQLGSFLGSGILGENLHENPTPDEVDQEKVFHRQIWAAFLDRCNIVGVPIDEALRSVLFYVRLPNNPHATNVLLEIAALQWFARNIERAQSSKVYVPDSQDTAVKLAFAIMTLNAELHNPLLRSESQPEAAYRELLLKFRASVVDDPAVAGKRKGNVLRKRDQPRVVTVMEVPPEHLRAIYERVLAARLVSCSDARPSAPEFDVDWVRDASDIAAPALTDDQIVHEIDDVYCDPGFRDGALFNASSDRLPAKFSIDPPAWLRVTVRIPEPDPKFSVRIRVLSVPADPALQSAPGGPPDVVAIVPANWLSFRASNTASFIVRPQLVGHFTLQFVSEGANARYYHPIPSRSMVVEGAFMRNTVQISWRRGDDQATRARYMFGMDTLATRSRWVHVLQTALKNTSDLPTKDILARVDDASRSLAALAIQQQQQRPADQPDSAAADQSVTALQILAALHAA